MRYTWTFLVLCSLWGEGFVKPMPDEGVHFWTKKHGEESQLVQEPCQTRNNHVVKRSYKRALKRVRMHGWTWYRGRMLSHAPGSTTDPVLKSTNLPAPAPVKRSRMTCISWNTGGLSGHLWDGFQSWIREQNMDLVMLQETHWTNSIEWSQDRFHCIHSGTGSRKGGIMCMVAKQFCAAKDISWHEPLPGRILHLRIHGASNSIDVINVYQFVSNHSNLESRAEVWNLLQSLIQSIPKRNILILGGDFNCSLRQRSSSVGAGTFLNDHKRCFGSVHSDEDLFHSILKTHDIQALNTWSLQNTATYEFGLHRSRIDFLCCKRVHSDQTARDVHALVHFPLLPDTGARHLPLVTTILKKWHSMNTQRQSGWSRKQRIDLHRRLLHDSHYAETLQTRIHDGLAHLCTDQLALSLQPMHDTMNHILAPTHSECDAPLYLHAQGPCQQLHWHARQLRSLVTSSLATCFRSWYHVIQKDKIRCTLRINAKNARKLRVAKVMQQAQHADLAHDHFRLYEAIIRALAPKQTHRRVMLRDDHGTPLDPERSATALQEWLTDLYHDSGSHIDGHSFLWPFTREDFAQGLRDLPGHKALDPAYAPSPGWHLAADSVAHLLQPCFECWSDTARFPPSWSNGELTFLPKPGKPGRHPSELRPIALLEPTGKTVMGLLANNIMTEALPYLCQFPQLAYLPGRGCAEAVQQMSTHCQQVRALLNQHSYPIHQRAAGLTMPGLHGGLLISLDLTKAFDMVPRFHLFDSLTQCGISSALIEFLKSIYSTTTFSFTHRGQHRSFETRKGIRQGCKAAPILWCCFSVLILSKIADATTWIGYGCLHIYFSMLTTWFFIKLSCNFQMFMNSLTKSDWFLISLNNTGW